jgi:hypothetical protein
LLNLNFRIFEGWFGGIEEVVRKMMEGGQFCRDSWGSAGVKLESSFGIKFFE